MDVASVTSPQSLLFLKIGIMVEFWGQIIRNLAGAGGGGWGPLEPRWLRAPLLHRSGLQSKYNLFRPGHVLFRNTVISVPPAIRGTLAGSCRTRLPIGLGKTRLPTGFVKWKLCICVNFSFHQHLHCCSFVALLHIQFMLKLCRSSRWSCRADKEFYFLDFSNFQRSEAAWQTWWVLDDVQGGRMRFEQMQSGLSTLAWDWIMQARLSPGSVPNHANYENWEINSYNEAQKTTCKKWIIKEDSNKKNK